MWQVVGQTRVVFLLQNALDKLSFSHAYLVVGPPHVGKMTLAVNLAQALNCEARERPCGKCTSCRRIAAANHADVQVVGLLQNGSSAEAFRLNQAEAKLISIEQVREIQHSASLPPFEGKYKVFIIDGAELMSAEAANCLLKTLEEPVGKVVFILLTMNESLLLPTVISRCQKLELRPLASAEIESALQERWGIEPNKARLLARLSHGCLGWAVSAANDEALLKQRGEELDKLIELIGADYERRFTFAAHLAAQFGQSRGQVHDLLDLWLDFWHDLMLVKVNCSDMITNVDRVDTLVELARSYQLSNIEAFINCIQAAAEQLRQNANPRLVLEVLMLDMPGKEIIARKPSLT